MRAIRRYAVLRVSIRDVRRGDVVRDLSHCALHGADTYSFVGTARFAEFHRSRRDDSAEREQGKKRLDTAMDKFEFVGAKPILVAVRKTASHVD